MAQPCPKSGPSAAAEPRGTPRKRWTARRTRIFFEHLAMTCNVMEALEMCGMSYSSLYRRRRECAEFRREWEMAIEEGYNRLEAVLLDRALNGETQEVVNRNGEVVTIRKSCTALGLALVKLRAARATALRDLESKRFDGKTREQHVFDAKATILKRIEMLAAHKKREEEEEAARAQADPTYTPKTPQYSY